MALWNAIWAARTLVSTRTAMTSVAHAPAYRSITAVKSATGFAPAAARASVSPRPG